MAKITIPDRICPHCGGIEWDYKINKKQGEVYYCSKKKKEAETIYREENREKIRAKQRIWESNNREKCNASSRRSYQKNRDTQLAYHKAYNQLPINKEKRKQRERLSIVNLDDNRVKIMLRHHLGIKEIKHKDIPQELVELKRKQLKLYRNAKEINNAANS